MDEKDVQTEEVSKEETTSTETETTETEQPQEQPFTEAQEAKIQQLLTDAISLGEQRGVETGRRQMQGIKDREVTEAQRRAAKAESRATAYDASLRGLDEETQKDIELARLRGESQYYQTFEQQEETRRQFAAVVDNFENTMTEYITGLGIDPKHKDIDWGDRDATNLTDRQKQILTSLSKIQKESAKVAEEKAKDTFKELETKLRKDLGLDSVDTSTSAGVSGSDQDFVDKIVSGELELTKENEARFKKIQGI